MYAVLYVYSLYCVMKEWMSDILGKIILEFLYQAFVLELDRDVSPSFLAHIISLLLMYLFFISCCP